MIDFVLKDVNPLKVKDFSRFLAEMNDLTVLLTVAKGPFIAFKLTQSTQEGFTLHLSENQFEAHFNGTGSADNAKNGRFELKHNRNKIVEIYYTVNEGLAVDMRVILNTEGEMLAKQELARNFKRDFSQSAHEVMASPLQELKLKMAAQKMQTELENSAPIDAVEQKITAVNAPVDETVTQEDTSSQPIENTHEITGESGEITQDLELTARAREFFEDTRALLHTLNTICYDLTRGATPNFSESPLINQSLENGAQVEMADLSNEIHTVTFRRGSLNNLTEISFFLEKNGELVFSLYMSTDGKATITSQKNGGHIFVKKVQDFLF